MWGLIILLVCGAQAYQGDQAPPRYVQAKSSFGHARLFIQQNIPYGAKDIDDPVSRQHFAFAILVAVTGNIAGTYAPNSTDYVYDPFTKLQQQVPVAWENYNWVSYFTNKYLSDVQGKIQPILSLINVLCSTADTVATCNKLVDERVKRSDKFVQRRASLLLELGNASDTLKRNESELLAISKSFHVVPYLLTHVKTPSYERFIAVLASIDRKVRGDSIGPYNQYS